MNKKKSFFSELGNCETFTSNENKYSSFFDIWSIDEKNSEEYVVDLKFFVLTHDEVYIMLTPSTNITNETLFYEIGEINNIFISIKFRLIQFIFSSDWK